MGVLLLRVAVMLVVFLALLRRALAPLESLTWVMRSVDPLAPEQVSRSRLRTRRC
jgi:hypothetical protein